jgi:hypothetical protein
VLITVVVLHLVLMMQIADKEIARKEELDKLLDFMCQQLEQLKVIDSIPKDIRQLDSLINRALDVRSACMRYLAINIRHDATIFGTPGTPTSIIPTFQLIIAGKVFKTFTTGDRKLNDTKIDLKSSVEDYSRTLSNVIHLRVSINTYTLVEKGSFPITVNSKMFSI